MWERREFSGRINNWSCEGEKSICSQRTRKRPNICKVPPVHHASAFYSQAWNLPGRLLGEQSQPQGWGADSQLPPAPREELPSKLWKRALLFVSVLLLFFWKILPIFFPLGGTARPKGQNGICFEFVTAVVVFPLSPLFTHKPCPLPYLIPFAPFSTERESLPILL